MEREAREAERKPKRKKTKSRRKKSLYRSPGRAIKSQEDFYPRSGTARRKPSHPTSAKARPQTAYTHQPRPPVPPQFPATAVHRESSSDSEDEKRDQAKFQFSEPKIETRKEEIAEPLPVYEVPSAPVNEESSSPTPISIPNTIAQHEYTVPAAEAVSEPFKAGDITPIAAEMPAFNPTKSHSSSSSSSSSSSKSKSPPPVQPFNPPTEAEASDHESHMRQQLPAPRYSEDPAEAKDYSGFEATSPVHPIRAVTKSYDVTIPMGKYTNKKITYVNASDQIANFTLVSSNPTEMEVREAALTIEPGEKGALKLQFNPVYEEITKHYYLYVDRDGQPWECFEFVITFD
jgi:hypothetical protein